jgi:hypothetical protein
MAGKINAALRITGYPVIQLMTLCETGTRALIGAMFGSLADGELAWACKLLHLLDEPMPVLMDRGLDAGEFLADVAATKAQFLVRLTATRQPPVLRMAPLPRWSTGVVKDRIVAASVTVTCHDGARYGGAYRWPPPCSIIAPTRPRADGLAPRALGTRDHPSHAAAHLLPGRVLRSDDPVGLE